MGACATAGPASPVEVVRAYASAPPAERRALMVDSTAGSGQALPGLGSAVEIARSAVWQVPGHHRVAVARTDGRWMLTTGGLASQVAETPAQAIALFTRAVTSQDAELMRALMPSEDRARWTLERTVQLLSDPGFRALLEALVDALRGVAVAEPAGAPGHRTTVGGPEGQVVLLREVDGWKVLDLRPSDRFAPRRAPDAPAPEP